MPVKFTEERSENFRQTIHGRDQVEYVEAAVKNDGTIVGLKLKLFGSAPVSPWISVGGGVAHITMNDPSATRGDTKRTSGTLQAGGGIDIRTAIPLIALRAEIRNYWPETPFRDFIISPHRPRQILGAGGVVLRF